MHYIDGLQALWDKALVDAARNVQGAQDGGSIDFEYDDSKLRYSVRDGHGIDKKDVDSLKQVGRKSIFAFTSNDIANSRKWGEMFWDELGEKSPFFRAWIGDWREFDTDKITVINSATGQKGDYINNDTGWTINFGRQLSKETSFHKSTSSQLAIKSLKYADAIIEKSILLDTVVSDKPKYSTLFHSLYAVTNVDGQEYLVKLVVEQLDDYDGPNTIRRAYKLVNIKETPIWRNGLQPHRTNSVSTHTVAELYALVKQYDKDFSPKAANSAMLDESGKPKKFYHGTAEEFWTFDKRKANDALGRKMGLGAGKGKFYLSEYRGVGQAAANSAVSLGKGKMPRVMELYVSAQKVMDRSKYEQRLSDAFKKYPNSDPSSAYYDYKARDKAIAEVDRAIRKEGYDCVWDRESGELFVFDPTQIKSATDNVGTFDPQNPDIRYSRRDADYLAAVERNDMEQAKRMVDEAAKAAGYTVKAYHGRYHNTVNVTVERIDAEIANNGASSENYSRAYMAYISPEDFLSLTTRNLEKIQSESRVMVADELRENEQTPFLTFDQESGEVTGHEGRHRMAAMMNAGVKRAAILIKPDGERGRYNRQVVPLQRLTGQWFNGANAPGDVTVENLVPVNQKHRQELIDTFSETDSWFRYSRRGGGLLSAQEAERLESNWNDYKYRGYQFTKRPNGGIMVSMGNLLVYTHPTGDPEYVLEIKDTGTPDHVCVENEIHKK